MNERKVIQVPVTFDSAARRKDKSVRLAFSTNLEITTRDYMVMDELIQKEGWLIFSENVIKPDEIPVEDAPGEERKSKIQRLKAVHYVYWTQKTDQAQDFQTWWDTQFEQLMNKYKERLD